MKKTPKWGQIENMQITQQESLQDIKYQEIIYFKNNSDAFISGLERRPIEFLPAMSEMDNIDWTYSKNYIGFSKKGDCALLFRRKNHTKWSVEVPIFDGEKWTGFGWFAYSDSKTISDMLRLYFEKVTWFGMLSWKMGEKAQ